jgi:hypothetical protein
VSRVEEIRKRLEAARTTDEMELLTERNVWGTLAEADLLSHAPDDLAYLLSQLDESQEEK